MPEWDGSGLIAYPGEPDITIAPDGKFINGVDFLLSRNPAGTVADLQQDEPHDKK